MRAGISHSQVMSLVATLNFICSMLALFTIVTAPAGGAQHDCVPCLQDDI